jgi:hypothetical protein
VRRSLLVLLCSFAVLAAACGDSGPDPQENPQAALTSAFESLQEAEGVTMTLSLHSDADSLVALSEGELDADAAEQILGSALTVTGRNETDPENAQTEVVVDIADVDEAVEMKVIGTTLYVRAAVRELMETFDADPAEADQFVADGKEVGLDWAEAAVDGEWLEFAGLDEMSKQFGAPGLEQTTKQQRELINKISAAMEENAEATPGDKEGPGDHLVVTVNVRRMYTALSEAMTSLGGAFAGAGLPVATDIPDQSIEFDLWIEDNFVRQMEFDLLQLAKFADDAEIPEGVENAALRITMEEFDGDIEAPDEAVKVDTNQLMQMMTGVAGGMGGGGMGSPTAPGSTDICEQLKGAPPEVLEQFATECPELLEN